SEAVTSGSFISEPLYKYENENIFRRIYFSLLLPTPITVPVIARTSELLAAASKRMLKCSGGTASGKKSFWS
ncbi:MAG TPA: hypothetical protein VJB05_03870, partial [archaeon]|nr:hypothetical protein [archaeon]